MAAVNFFGLHLKIASNSLLPFQVSNAKKYPKRRTHLQPSASQRHAIITGGTSGYNPWIAYGQSKLANCLFSFELSRRCKVRGLPITSNCMHPGIVDTKLIRYVLPQALTEDSISMPSMRSTLLKLIGIRTPEEGARTSVYLAASRDVEDISGHYFEDCTVRTPSSKAMDADLASKHWNISEELTKTSYALKPLGLDQMSMEAIKVDSSIK